MSSLREREQQRERSIASSSSRSAAQSPLHRAKLSSHSYREAVGGAITAKYRYMYSLDARSANF